MVAKNKFGSKLKWLAILSAISAILYRVGGKGGFPKAKLFRRLGCGIVQFLAIFFALQITAYWWVHLLTIGLTFAGLSSYWDNVFGYDNHYAHGFGIGMGCILYLLTGSVMIWAFAIRVIVLTLLMGFLRKFLRKYGDTVEELAGGALVIITLAAFLIGRIT